MENKFLTEYNQIKDKFGCYETSVILGDIASYRRMRENFSYKEIVTSIAELNEVW